MNRKLTALLIVLVMLLSLMAGCAKQEEAPAAEVPAPAEETPAAEPAAEPAEEPVEETPAEAPEEAPVEAPAGESAPVEPAEAPEEAPEEDVYPLGEDLVLTAFAEFRPTDAGGMVATRGESPIFQHAAEITGVRLETQDCTQNAFTETFNLLMASGLYPDLIFNVNSYYGPGMDAAIDDEILIDLDPYLADWAPNYYAAMVANPQTMKDVHTDTGKCGQFFCLESEPQGGMGGYFIRSDLLAKTGKEAPQTLDEYHDILLALKDTCPELEYPMYVGSTGIDAIATAYGVGGISIGGGFGSMDLNYIVKDGKVDVPYFQDNYKTVLSIMNQWLAEGIYSRDFATQSTSVMPPDTNYYAAIINGDCALFNYTTNVADVIAAGVENNPDFAIEPVRTMVLNKGDILPATTTVTLVDSNGFGVSTQCWDTEIAMRYLDWWYGEEGSLTASYGIEGVTYTMDENGKPQWTDFMLKGDGTYTTNQIMYCYAVMNEMGQIDIHRQDYRKTPEMLEMQAFWDQDIDFTAGEGMSRYVTMTSEESDVYNLKVNDIATYVSETVPRFIFGDLNLEGDFDAYVATLHEMGIEECIAIKQAVFDRYQER